MRHAQSRQWWLALIVAVTIGNLAVIAVNSPPAIGQSQPPAGSRVTQTPARITYTNVTKVTCASTSTALLAVSTTGTREIIVKVPTTATTGIHLGVGAAATTNMLLVEPGESWVGSTAQSLFCLRAGGSDVTSYLQTGVSGW